MLNLGYEPRDLQFIVESEPLYVNSTREAPRHIVLNFRVLMGTGVSTMPTPFTNETDTDWEIETGKGESLSSRPLEERCYPYSLLKLGKIEERKLDRKAIVDLQFRVESEPLYVNSTRAAPRHIVLNFRVFMGTGISTMLTPLTTGWRSYILFLYVNSFSSHKKLTLTLPFLCKM